MGMVGFAVGFEMFPAMMLFASIGLFIAAIVDGPYWQHMIPVWTPGLIGFGVPLLALLVVLLFWKKTTSKEIAIKWLVPITLFAGPAYLYLGYWMLGIPLLMFLIYLPLSAYVLILVVLWPIGWLIIYFQEMKEKDTARPWRKLGITQQLWDQMTPAEQQDWLDDYKCI